MKLGKKLIIYAIVALVVQLAVLIYLNNFMLTSYTVFNPKTESIKVEGNKSSGIEMPENVDDLQASFNGQYCSYIKSNTIYVINMATGMRKKIVLDEGYNLDLFKWSDSNNNLIIAEQGTINGSPKLKIAKYDAERGIKEGLKDLSWLGSDIRLERMEFADGQDLVISMIVNNNKEELYYISDDVAKLPVNVENIDIFKYAGKDKDVLYGDENAKKYFLTGNKKTVQLKKKTSKILQVDAFGRIYITDDSQEQISTIYYRNLNNSQEQWQSIELNKPVELKNLIIARNGDIYTNDIIEGKFTNVNTNSTINYDGEYMAYFQGGILVLKDNVLNKMSFDKSKAN